jgi:hypothetical protein
MSKCFGMNCDHVLRWNAKSYKICAFKKIIFIKKWLTQNMWHIGAIVNIINKNLQNISFENSFLWRRCF